jgi:hypothetical protein
MHAKTFSLAMPIIKFFAWDAISARCNLLLAHEEPKRHSINKAEKLSQEK